MKILKKNRELFCLILIPYIYILIICIVRVNQSATLTGDITPVDSLIELDVDNKQTGSFNTIYVISYDYPTIFQSRILETSTINKTTEVSNPYFYMTNSEINQMSKLQHNNAIQTALITAYNEAMKVDSEVYIDYTLTGAVVNYYKEAASNFKIGDKIIGVNGIYASVDVEVFRNEFNTREEGDIFNVLRSDKEIEILADANHYKGFLFYPIYDIDYENAKPKIKVNSTSIGGPSGGLLQTLDVFNHLTAIDYSLGKTISGTGTISLDGTVGGIGAVEQKIYTAYKRGVDIFFCPSVNYEDAKKAWDTLKNKERMALVKVDTLAEAIEYLTNEMQNN